MSASGVAPCNAIHRVAKFSAWTPESLVLPPIHNHKEAV